MKFSRIILILIIPIYFLGSSCVRESGRKNATNHLQKPHIEQQSYIASETTGQTIVEMETESGVRFIWVEINGLRLRFIFDTGASIISISSSEATVLYRQGTLRKEDILDIQYFQDATGRVSAGTRINLRTVKIGDRILRNIEAIVIDSNEAPLLLGQSALERFGRISIDNQKGVIIFE